MVSLRFPILFSQFSKTPTASSSTPSRFFATAAATVASFAAVASEAAGTIAISQNQTNTRHPWTRRAVDIIFQHSHLWASLSILDSSSPVVESKTGASFPSILGGSRRLLGVGMRKKSVMGLKNINVYAFGVYADDNDIKSLLTGKYGNLSPSDLKNNPKLGKAIMESGIRMTIRLEVVYGRLSIGAVRSAFQESVGSRLKKFGGPDVEELLQRFISQFKDEYKIPRGSVIDLSMERGYVLCTTIDGKEAGSIQSRPLCSSILDLYIGDDPFDGRAKEDVELSLASLLQK